MSSAEFLTTALWQPLDPSMRTWERSSKATSTPRPAPRPSMAVMGAAGPLSTDKLSGVLSPSDLRVKQKVVQGREIDVSKKVKQDVLSMENPRQETSPPELKSDHVWGVREDWGKGAGTWGKGASVHEKPEKV
jgi:protein AFG1